MIDPANRFSAKRNSTGTQWYIMLEMQEDMPLAYGHHPFPEGGINHGYTKTLPGGLIMILTAEQHHRLIKTPLYGYRSKHLTFLVKAFS